MTLKQVNLKENVKYDYKLKFIRHWINDNWKIWLNVVNMVKVFAHLLLIGNTALKKKVFS